MRLVFLGNDAWSVPALEALAGSSHEIALVITREPRPAGRGNELRPTAVADSAGRLGLPLLEVATVAGGPGLEALQDAAADVLAVVAYGEILPRKVLDAARIGAVNLHFSLLPKLRGASPVQYALLEGLAETGSSTMLLDEGMDTGDVLMQRADPVLPEDDSETLGNRLAVSGAALLVETMDVLEHDLAEPIPQAPGAATFAPKLQTADRNIDWLDSADAIAGKVRALAPVPGATTRFRGKILKVFRAGLESNAGQSGTAAGTVFSAKPDDFSVASGTSPVSLLEVALEGRKRMAAADFVRGYRPEPGERLG